MLKFIITIGAVLVSVLISGCSSLLLNNIMKQPDLSPKTDLITLASIEALIEKQPAKYELFIHFKPHDTDISRQQLEKVASWIQKPVKDVIINVGPVRHKNVIQAIAISRARSLRVLTILNTFNISARISYDPNLSVDSLEVSGWL